MLVVNSALKQDQMKEIVLGLADVNATFSQKKGPKMYFETSDDDAAIPVVKKALKAVPDFAAIYFAVTKE